jgi:hypothetical protein
MKVSGAYGASGRFEAERGHYTNGVVVAVVGEQPAFGELGT